MSSLGIAKDYYDELSFIFFEMTDFSKNIVQIVYDFIETYITKDYQHAYAVIQPNISLSRDKIILDIGGGTGVLLKNFSQEVNYAILLDSSRQMLMHSYAEDIISIQGDGVELPIKDEGIDIVFLIHVLHHVHRNDHYHLFDEIYRVLSFDGSCYILDLYYPMTVLNTLFTIIEELAFGKTFHVTNESVTHMVKKVGFRYVDCFFTDVKKWRYFSIVKK